MFTLQKLHYQNILSIEHLEIQAHKITCIVGESGTGKSTLLKLLNKLYSPTSGTIFYNGIDLAQWDSIALRRKVVMLPQRIPLYPGTIRDNLLIGLRFAEKPVVDDATLCATLQSVHLAKPLDASVEYLSGGEMQRLGLARILLLEPEVFLLDEPSSALDETSELRIIEDLVAYTTAHRKTLIMVTHSTKIAQTFADEIIEIEANTSTKENNNGNHH
ncbi:MAG: ABC transporter ATP-binding protein [Erysipelotrichaceae bacterium]